ncbi:hypothetical protein GBF38_019716 [Nibea albiflora]|uniref:Uncharacterized protein n=1 Tax=Nibea albiflora TaxID=240163 RepID=A0ACB7F302_NIBAL|nr:hypothetical protein GBF38_019716 [Nibea albiflora]
MPRKGKRSQAAKLRYQKFHEFRCASTTEQAECVGPQNSGKAKMSVTSNASVKQYSEPCLADTVSLTHTPRTVKGLPLPLDSRAPGTGVMVTFTHLSDMIDRLIKYHKTLETNASCNYELKPVAFVNLNDPKPVAIVNLNDPKPVAFVNLNDPKPVAFVNLNDPKPVAICEPQRS